MAASTDPRPPVAVGHVHFAASDVAAAAKWFEALGLRSIAGSATFAVLELRGGTHLVVSKAEAAPEPGAAAPFDLMVDDIDAAHRDYASHGFEPSTIRRGRIHDSFTLPAPDGATLSVVSSHAGNRAV